MSLPLPCFILFFSLYLTLGSQATRFIGPAGTLIGSLGHVTTIALIAAILPSELMAAGLPLAIRCGGAGESRVPELFGELP